MQSMQNFLSANFVKIREQSTASGLISQGSSNELPLPAKSFENFLSERLNDTKTNTTEQKPELSDINKGNNGKTQGKQELKSNSKNHQVSENQGQNQNQNEAGDNRDIPSLKDDKENMQVTGNTKANSKDTKKSPGHMEKKDPGNIIRINNSVIRKKSSSDNEDHSLLKDIVFLLEALKSLPLDKKQVQEIRTALQDFKNDNLNRKPEIAANVAELKKLFDQFKAVIETANEGVRQKANIGNKINFKAKIETGKENRPENKYELADIAALKKQLVRLTKEIREHLDKKIPEKAAAGPGEFQIENKNTGSQKILYQAAVGERNEASHLKDNSFNNSFAFSGKEAENPAFNFRKTGISGNQRTNSFNDQLSSIVQNARIVVRDSRNGSFSISLHPEELGRVNVNLNLEQGVIMGKFLVDSAEAKEALLENMYNIRETLQKEGILVGDFQVNVRDENSHTFAFHNDDQMNSVTGNRDAIQSHEYEIYSSYTHDGQIDVII